MTTPRLSVVIPTRNPHRGRLAEVLAGLNRQTLPAAQWEFCLVDNGSSPALLAEDLARLTVAAHIVREEEPGLIAARLRGIAATCGEFLLFIDDDTIPADDLLAEAVAFMETHPHVGTAGGKITPRFETSPPAWLNGAEWCLALRDNGEKSLEWFLGPEAIPFWTPIGAGLLARRAALVPGYSAHVASHRAAIMNNSWHGQGCGGVEDKDLVLHCLRAGWSVAYAPRMVLTHIIPSSRLNRSKLERLIPTLERMWMRTLHAHGLDLFPPIHPATLWPRQIKAWFAMRAWRTSTARFQWLSSCGRLRGLADNYRSVPRYAAPFRS